MQKIITAAPNISSITPMRSRRVAATLLVVYLFLGVFVQLANSAAEPTSETSNDDWPMLRHDPAHTGHSPKTLNISLNVAWTYKPSISYGFYHRVPAVANGYLYITDDNYLYCIDASTGNPHWIQNLTIQGPITQEEFSTAVYDGYVYTDNAAYDALTGKLVFTFPVQASTSPTVTDGAIYMGSKNGGVIALNATTGGVLWDTKGELLESSPAVSNGAVYYSYGNPWRQSGESYAVAALTGKEIWHNSAVGGLYAHVAVANGYVYINGFSGLFYCLNATSGATVWSYPAYAGWHSNSPAVTNEYVYAGPHIFNASTGTLLYNNSILTGSAPAVTSESLYVGYYNSTNSGMTPYVQKLYTLSGFGEGITSYKFPGEYEYDTYSSPVIANSMVYICAIGSNEIYAFGNPASIDGIILFPNLFSAVLIIGITLIAVVITAYLFRLRKLRRA
ncbi:MAG: PQQ-like beta-propeller repeat protein [Candidatus Bathyarchaeota archaeon]|nr:PQQ-like beta-propeller repeat protein [Candidatus Bathyarchaeota archaeon]